MAIGSSVRRFQTIGARMLEEFDDELGAVWEPFLSDDPDRLPMAPAPIRVGPPVA